MAFKVGDKVYCHLDVNKELCFIGEVKRIKQPTDYYLRFEVFGQSPLHRKEKHCTRHFYSYQSVKKIKEEVYQYWLITGEYKG